MLRASGLTPVKFTKINTVPLSCFATQQNWWFRWLVDIVGKEHVSLCPKQARGWDELVLPGSAGWTSCLGINSSAWACPQPPTSPMPALSYVQRTHKEIGGNCRDGCFGLMVRWIYFSKNLIVTLSLNKQKIQLTANIFQHSPSHLFKHFKCHQSPVNRSGIFHRDPSGPTCYITEFTVARSSA